MRKLIITALLALSSFSTLAQEGTPELTADAPEKYVVQEGDTLWGLAEKFLKDPWRWQDLWKANKDAIPDPKQLRPGVTLFLDKTGDTPRLRAGQVIAQGGSDSTTRKLTPQVHAEATHRVIPVISAATIRPFLSEPRVVDEKMLEAAPRILASDAARVMLSMGDTAYAHGDFRASKIWQAFRPVKAIADPETGKVIAYEAYFLGTLRLSRHGNDAQAASLEIIDVKQEIGPNDRLLPALSKEVASFMPHAPKAGAEGRVASIYGGLGEAGPTQVVTLNRGQAQGLEPGHVLALYRKPKAMTVDPDNKDKLVFLPPKRYGLAMVFKVFDGLAYALVMNASEPVYVGDIFLQP